MLWFSCNCGINRQSALIVAEDRLTFSCLLSRLKSRLYLLLAGLWNQSRGCVLMFGYYKDITIIQSMIWKRNKLYFLFWFQYFYQATLKEMYCKSSTYCKKPSKNNFHPRDYKIIFRYMSTRITEKRLLFSCNHVTISYLQMSCCTQIRFFVSVVIWFFVGIFWINLMVCYKGCCFLVFRYH